MPGITAGQGVQGRACTQGSTVPTPLTWKRRREDPTRPGDVMVAFHPGSASDFGLIASLPRLQFTHLYNGMIGLALHG